MVKRSYTDSRRYTDRLTQEQVYHTKQKKSAKAIALIVVLVLLSACLFTGCFNSVELEDGIIMNNVKIAGIDVGGMTTAEAASALRLTVVDGYEQNPMVVHIADQQAELSPEITQVSLDVEGAVEAAYALGRTGSRSQKKDEQLLASTVGITVDLGNYISINEDSIHAYLAESNLAPDSEVIQSTWEVIGELPDLTAEELPEELQQLVIHIGTPAYTYSRDTLMSEILEAYMNREFIVELSAERNDPDPINLEEINQLYYVEPLDAVMDDETCEVYDHSYGYSLDLEAAAPVLEDASFGSDLEFSFVATAPSQTKEALSGMLFRDVLAKHKATANSIPNRNTNLRLACEAINGTVIMPGEIFDYNEGTGKRTAEKGYLMADGYVNGKTVKVIAGGVCQPSSVLYYCALLADMEIVQRHNHQYISSYMDPGMDATVSWGGPNLRIRNNTDYPIRIEASASGGSVTISLIGTDTKDYYTKMSYEIVERVSWKTEYVEMEADNEDGYKDGQVISTPYTGYTVKTYRCKYSKADNSLIEKTLEATSVYDHRDKKIVKIIGLETEPPTEAPTEKPTDAPATETPTEKPIENTTAPSTDDSSGGE